MLDYTKQTGKTEAVKEILSYLQSQENILNTIKEKESKKNNFAVGDDQTLDEERRQLSQAQGNKQGVV